MADAKKIIATTAGMTVATGLARAAGRRRTGSSSTEETAPSRENTPTA